MRSMPIPRRSHQTESLERLNSGSWRAPGARNVPLRPFEDRDLRDGSSNFPSKRAQHRALHTDRGAQVARLAGRCEAENALLFFFPEIGREANGTALRRRRAHWRADDLVDVFELALSPQIQGDERALER